MKNILFLSDQDEYMSYTAFLPGDSSIQSALVNTRPSSKSENAAVSTPGFFTRVYDWHDVLNNTFDPFEYSKEITALAESVLFESHWPQSLDEVTKSDQYAYSSVSGRFFQRGYTSTYLINAFYATYTLVDHALNRTEAALVYTKEFRDVNKVAGICACLNNGVPIIIPEPMNYKSKFLLRVITKGRSGINNNYIGSEKERGGPIQIFRCHEALIENKISVSWESCASASTSVSESVREINDVSRNEHHERFNIRKGASVISDLTALPWSFIQESRSAVRSVIGLLKARNKKVIPWHKKNATHYLAASFGKPAYKITCRIKSIVSRLGPVGALKNPEVDKKDILLCLHYFPESTTISGLSWRNVKIETELLNESNFVRYFPPHAVQIIEHPVYIVNGERPREFWKRMQRAGYRDIIKASYGVDLAKISGKKIVTIAGSIALEGALSGARPVLIKNSLLLNVKDIAHISEVIRDKSWHLNVAKDIPAQDYIDIAHYYGIESEECLNFLSNALSKNAPDFFAEVLWQCEFTK